ncbi:MAG TPA: M1 family aminopeptidase [Fimbriimonadaceae bacterium]|nr:M1 family aminopeptidase [Fimbriimonadaceae bacterium]
MHVACTVAFVPGDKATDTTTFTLADEMEVPKVRILAPAEIAGEATATKKSSVAHDVTYEVRLPKPLKANQELKLGFDYSSKAPRGFVYLLGTKECLAGGYNTCWFPAVGDSRRMTGKIEFDTPAGFIVKASGKEISAREEGGRRKTNFELGQPIVPTFAAAPFKVIRLPGTVPMTLYLLKDRPVAQEYAEGCSNILGVLTREFGPYPFPDFSIIETPSPESSNELGFSGASFEGFMFADSDSVDDGFNLAYFGHEIGHQWWGNLVQMDGDKGAYMLGEAMAQYGSLQCVDQIGGSVLAARYRSFGYPAYNSMQCGWGALLYGPTDADRPLAHMPPAYDPIYHQLANSKGFLVWDTIARQIGRDRFRKALHAVTSKYAWRSLTFDQFLDEIRAAAGQDVNPILDQWLERKGAPVVSSTWQSRSGGIDLTLRQTAPAYRLRLPVRISFDDGSAIAKVLEFDGESKTFSIPASKRVAAVDVDPNWEVFHSTPERQAEATALKDYSEALFASMRLQEDAETLFKQGLSRVEIPDRFGEAFMLHMGLGNLYRRANRPAEAKEQFEQALRCPVRRPELVPWVLFRLAGTLRAQGDERAAMQAAEDTESALKALPYRLGFESNLANFLHSGH